MLLGPLARAAGLARHGLDEFQHEARHRVQRRLDVARLRRRRLLRRAPGGQIRSPHTAAGRRRLLHRQCLGLRHCRWIARIRDLSDPGRPGGGCSQCHVTGLYQRDRPFSSARPTGDDSAGGDHRRPVLLVSQQLHPRQRRGWLHGAIVVRLRSLALHVLDGADPRRDIPHRAAVHPRKPALPGQCRS